MIIKRTTEAIKFVTDGWDLLDIPYLIKHGTYTTTLESEFGKHKFVVNNYSNRVFIAKNKVKKDVMESDMGKELMLQRFEKVNFGVDAKFQNSFNRKVLNIDLSSAYVYAIRNCELITKETFNYLQTLKKGERLPSLGMLASSHTKFLFQGGKCLDYSVHREPTAPIFYKLIQEINDVMEECRWILGSDYIFHWVDGIFFNFDTPPKKIRMIEEILQEFHFPYKYESVENFSFNKDGENYVISMVKNGERKTYNFGHREDYQRIKRFIAQSVKGKIHSV
jgi:hypothetical protein